MKHIFFHLLFTLKTLLGFGQQLQPQVMGNLPAALDENSSMVVISNNRILLTNDSGNPPIFFVVDSMGAIVREVQILDFPNVDWEGMAYDGNDQVFLADIGNNANQRRNLAIARFSLHQILTLDSVQPKAKMDIAYANQLFPTPDSAAYFDAESIVYARDSIRLFTKCRSQPFDGKLYQYNIPNAEGSYLLHPADSMSTGTGLPFSFWITDATYAPALNELILLGQDKIWRLSAGKPHAFLTTSTQATYALGSFTQKEAVDYVRAGVLYFSDERSAAGAPKLYRVELPMLSIDASSARDRAKVELLNLADSNRLELDMSLEAAAEVRYEIYNVSGQVVKSGSMGQLAKGQHREILDIQTLGRGSYVLNVLIDHRPYAFRFVRP